MSMTPGRTLAHYTLREKIGEGGMGAVYRATDSRLSRDVAIKVLPEDVAKDAERLARFQREAQLLASLNHPNIAAIHGLEEADGQPFLVLELVEGEDLAQRLSRGAIPIPEALGIARQIAEALEEAHESGIVHRDLKPANIKLTPAGKVKVLDFGLAKAFEPMTGAADDPSLSPTLTAAATRAGVILGTAAYMSPEQARGAVVDKRSDVWAFGCVLLEMITGRGTFSEATVTDTLASVLRSDPDWGALPPGAPAALTRLLRRCLRKDPRQRLRDIGEARVAIDEMLAGGDVQEQAPATAGSGYPRGRWLVPALVAAGLAAAVTAAGMLLVRPSPSGAAIEKYEVVSGDIQVDDPVAPAISPDGRRIVFVKDGGLWLRDLDQIDPRPLSGTNKALRPFWAPDSEWLGFLRDGSLWRISIRGGQAAAIASGVGEFGGGSGLSWGASDRIVFALGGGGLAEVSASGGDPKNLLEPTPGEEGDLHEPWLLPRGAGVLFVAHRLASTADSLYVLADGKRKLLLQLDGQRIGRPVYSPTGHILYHRQAANAGLWAVPFSLSRLETTGEPFLVAPDGSLPTVSDDGTLLYVRGGGGGTRSLVWVGRDGTLEEEVGQPQTRIGHPSISPDGRFVAVMGLENDNGDIWVHDIQRGTHSRLTFTPPMDWEPCWSPDGRQVIFWDGVTRAISSKAADGTGEVKRLVAEDTLDSGNPAMTPDGRTMALWVKTATNKNDIDILPLDGDGKLVPLIHSPANESDPQISPDGNYLAYVSDESGRQEIYLTRFPSAEGKWQVSVSGGDIPRWDPRGTALYYRAGDALMEVALDAGPAPRISSPRKLFTLTTAGSDSYASERFAVAPDGRRFLMVKENNPEGTHVGIVLIHNWLADLRRSD